MGYRLIQEINVSYKEVKMINIHLEQIGKLLGSSQFRYEDLLHLKAFLSKALDIVENTLAKIKKEEFH